MIVRENETVLDNDFPIVKTCFKCKYKVQTEKIIKFGCNYRHPWDRCIPGKKVTKIPARKQNRKNTHVPSGKRRSTKGHGWHHGGTHTTINPTNTHL